MIKLIGHSTNSLFRIILFLLFLVSAFVLPFQDLKAWGIFKTVVMFASFAFFVPVLLTAILIYMCRAWVQEQELGDYNSKTTIQEQRREQWANATQWNDKGAWPTIAGKKIIPFACYISGFGCVLGGIISYFYKL